MKLDDHRRSSNVEDRRGAPNKKALVGGGLGTIVILLIAIALGVDPAPILDAQQKVSGSQTTPSDSNAARPPEEDKLADFTAAVLATTEDVWRVQLPKQVNTPYREPKLVLFTGEVQSACGHATAAVGPFYCPGDEKAYIDLQFYDDLARRFGAPGDFAQAYVIAHEVGHHIQNILGQSGKVQRMRRELPKAEGNKLSVKLELQADCYSGIWAHFAERGKQLLEEGDLKEGLDAAAAIGDDTLQRRATGRVQPESFTHGSSEDRVKWFTIGFETGSMEACDTFKAP